MEKNKKLYLVWQDGEDEQFFNQYNSLIDAVCAEENEDDVGVLVYEAVPKELGRFLSQAQPVKLKKVKK